MGVNRKINILKSNLYQLYDKEYVDETITNLSCRFSTMKQRCYNPNSKDFKNYGGRGIKICEEWLEDITIFMMWAISNGYRKELHIDRENNDLEYSSNNCRFTTLAENNRNQRRPKADYIFVYEVLLGKYKNMSGREISKLEKYSASTVHRIRDRDCTKELENYKNNNQ